MNFHTVNFFTNSMKLSCKSGEPKCNSHWVIMLVFSYGTNYNVNEHEDFSHYGPYAILSKIIPRYSHPACFLNQNDTLNELSFKQNHFRLIMSLAGIKILTNMAHIISPKAKLMPCCSYSTSLIGQNVVSIVLANSFDINYILDTNYVLEILLNMAHTQHNAR